MRTYKSALFGRTLAAAAIAVTLSVAAFGADPAKDNATTSAGGGADPQSVSAGSADTNTAPAPAEKPPHHDPFLGKMGMQPAATGGVDPHGDSWKSIQNSLQQFAHPDIHPPALPQPALAVGCSWVVAWHPRARTDGPAFGSRRAQGADHPGRGRRDRRGTGREQPTLAFVIFGIGALLRFRTVLDNPKATGKAILVVVIGLACGMGSWAMAVFVTAFSWGLIYWLDSHVGCRLTIRLDGTGDPKPLQQAVQSLLLLHRCRLQSSTVSKSRKRIEFLFHMPAGLDQELLEGEVKTKLPKTGEPRVTIEVA